MSEENTFTTEILWDEIIREISFGMTHRLYPVLNEVYGKDYLSNISIRLYSARHFAYQDDSSKDLSSGLMDISITVNGMDDYRIASVMDDDHRPVIWITEQNYNLYSSIKHDVVGYDNTGNPIVRFPRCMLIYLDSERCIPDEVQCQMIYSRTSKITCQIRAISIQSYDLEEICDKQLDFFIPFTLLRFRPLLDNKEKKMSTKELTDFVEQLIGILETEVETGTLTQRESFKYIHLLLKASAHIFHNYPEYHEEVLNVISSMTKLSSMEIRELQQAITEKEAAIRQMDACIAELEQKLAARQSI